MSALIVGIVPRAARFDEATSVTSSWPTRASFAVVCLSYGAAAAQYVDAFMENINWTNVARLHQAHAR